jgi:hypothetical protein
VPLASRSLPIDTSQHNSAYAGSAPDLPAAVQRGTASAAIVDPFWLPATVWWPLPRPLMMGKALHILFPTNTPIGGAKRQVTMLAV